MLSNLDLENLCIHYKLPMQDICMKDELPAQVEDGNYILNLQNSKDKNGNYNVGSHWLGLIIKGNESCFFDSFGAPPAKEICDFIKKRRKCHLAYNNWVIQDLKSDNCGYYALSYLIFMNSENSLKTSLYAKFNNYLNQFGDDTIQNDAILKDFFRKMGGNMPPKIKRLLKEKIISR